MAIRNWLRRRDRYAEAHDEIEAHIRMAIRDRMAAGESEEEASRHARVELGSVRGTVEEAQAVWRWSRLEQAVFDARSGVRILKTAPGLSATTILLVALVIGGNTTIYSAVHAMLTKPAPGVRPDNLAVVSWLWNGRIRTPVTTSNYVDALQAARLSRNAAFRAEPITLQHEAGAYAVRGAAVTPNYFDTLRVPFVRGRGFTAGDARLGPRGLVTVISERLWERHFGRRDDAIGREVRVDGHPATIIGVVAAPFQGVWLAEATDLWLPLDAFMQATGETGGRPAGVDVDGIVTRIAGGGTLAEAEAELRAIASGVDAAAGPGAPRHEPSLVEYTGVAARQNMIAHSGPRFLSIFSIVTLLTVCIVCANVANLMLARAVSRQREMAVRQSFGASRARIMRLVLAENLTLALLGWVFACLFAYWVSRALPGLIPASESGGAEVLLDFTPDWQVVAYAMLLALTAAGTFTIAPAIRTWRLDLLSFLKAGERGVAQGRGRATRALVVIQLALSVVLLTSAGLAYRSLSMLTDRDLGFETDSILLVTVDMTAADSRTPEAMLAMRRAMLEATGSVPAVRSASYARQPPSRTWFRREVRASADATAIRAELNYVGPDFLRTLGLKPARGLAFERTAATGQTQAIVNQYLADALWPGVDPIGKSLHYASNRTAKVAGVMPNALIGGHRREAKPYMALLSEHDTLGSSLVTFYLRHHGATDAVVPAITRAMRDAAPSVPITFVTTMDGALHDMTWTYRTLTTLLLMFAGGSLFIAVLGQYAAMAFAMRQRVREFAVRMAVGASGGQVLLAAMREGLWLTTIGLVIGLALGAVAGNGGRSLLHGIAPTDPTTYAAVLGVLGAASLAACYLPARRAARVDPIDALRAE